MSMKQKLINETFLYTNRAEKLLEIFSKIIFRKYLSNIESSNEN